MTQSGISHAFSVSELRQHSSNLDQVSQSVASANDAANEAQAGVAAAYGQFFGWIVEPGIQMLVGSVTDFGANLSDMVQASATSVSSAAENYEACEEEAIELCQTILRDLQCDSYPGGVR